MKSINDKYILLSKSFLLMSFSPTQALADPGDRISGTVTTETPVGSWSYFQVDVHDSDYNLTISTPVNMDGSYQTSGIVAGTYYVQFKDNGGDTHPMFLLKLECRVTGSVIGSVIRSESEGCSRP